MNQSDEQLARDVRYELEHDHRVDARHLHVTVNEGVAVVSGVAPNLAAKQSAIAAACRVASLHRVFDGISIDQALAPPADGEIADRVLAILGLDAGVPSGAISVEVRQGEVTLLGRVDWNYQREAARSAAARIAGVTQVHDSIVVTGPPSVADLRGRVLAALEKRVETLAAVLDIAVEDGVVRLEGLLDGSASIEIAKQAVREAPGVVEVDNRLKAV